MRRFRVVSWSILSARLSLSAMSSSTELDAVLTSMPSFLRRSMTSWLGRPRSLASWKTLTFPIRLPPWRPVGHDLTRRLRRLLERGVRLRRRLGGRCLVSLRRLLGGGLLLRPAALPPPPLPGGALPLGQAALLLRLLGGHTLRLHALRLHPLGLEARRFLRVLLVP